MMIPALLMLISSPALGGVPADAIVRATLPEGALVIGQMYELRVELELGEGWSASEAGLPNAVLQLGVPDCITLVGDVLEGRALARNEFLQAPFERTMDQGNATVAFTLTGEPDADDLIAVNVLAFAQQGEDETTGRFIRRRIELPVVGGAKAASAEQTTISTWSGGDPGLSIGARATSFQLPRADGTTVELSPHLGQSNVIVTTYRAFW